MQGKIGKKIAEGVETQAQANFLKLKGCDEVQGYFYGKPMEGRELASLMAKTAYPDKRLCNAMACSRLLLMALQINRD